MTHRDAHCAVLGQAPDDLPAQQARTAKHGGAAVGHLRCSRGVARTDCRTTHGEVRQWNARTTDSFELWLTLTQMGTARPCAGDGPERSVQGRGWLGALPRSAGNGHADDTCSRRDRLLQHEHLRAMVEAKRNGRLPGCDVIFPILRCVWASVRSKGNGSTFIYS